MEDLDTFDNDDEQMSDTDADNQPQETPNALRRAAADGKRAKAELAAARKDLALLRAGVDLDSPLGAMFSKAYDGEITPESIKTAWAAIAPAATHTPDTSPPATDDPELTPEELASTGERQALAHNAPADATKPAVANPFVEMRKAFDAVEAGGGKSEYALAAGIDVLLKAAATGDQRVIVEKSQQ